MTAAAESLRTGWYPDEAGLTPQLLEEEGAFGRNFEVPVHGQVYAQPLVSGHTLLVATEDNWVYGIDSRSGEVRWERNVGTPWNSEDLECPDLAPHVGITGTPVIDPNTNTAYFFSKTYVSGAAGPAEWKMHAVDLANGEERPGFPVKIEGNAQNLPVAFEPTHQLERPALLLMNGVVYAGFGSHCDFAPFHGWIVGVSTSGQIKTMWAVTEQNGGAIWMGGAGLASDGEGQLLFATGNNGSPPPGPGSSPPENELGESVVRARVEPDGTLKPTDFFSPYNNAELDLHDVDLGSSGPLLLPPAYFGTGAFPHLVIQVGKSGRVYLLNGDSLGGMGQGPEGKNADLGERVLENGVWGSLATWPGDGGYIYAPSSGEEPGNGALEVLKYGTNGLGDPQLTFAGRATGLEFGSGSPIVTSDGATAGSGIVWISHCTEAFKCEGSTLNAYAAAVPVGTEPKLLWHGPIGVSAKFARPDAGGERIYVGTRDGKILAFGATHHALTVVRETAAGGSVGSDVEGIDCGQVCAHAFANGAAVTLTATPAPHFEFTGWSGGGCSGTGACHLTMYSDATVTAAFVAIDHKLTVTKAGAGEGTVISRPPGIDCGGSCSAQFPEASNVALEALPGPTAVTWSGCTSASGRICEVNLGADREVTASFLPLPNTTITAAKIDARRRKATFRYQGTAEARSFECRLMGPAGRPRRPRSPFAPCGRTRTFKHLHPGRYIFQVRAINAAGADQTPAMRRFKI